MSLLIELLPKVAANLEIHPEAKRIKKFIYCLCKNKWENNLDTINQYSLEYLLKKLVKAQPTLNRLSLAMYELVKRLNHPQTYATIAKIILEKIAPVYQADRDDIKDSPVQLIYEKENAKRILQRENAKKIFGKEHNLEGFDLPVFYTNVMEELVSNAIIKELKNIPPDAAKKLNIAEIAAYALNHLPPLYVATEEEKIEQLSKALSMKERIYFVVLESIKVVRDNPLKNHSPLK
ncbi:MAG: late competence development ComFB family protein [Snowella sp.]|nr:late competence development ComFB family protein [Snowella sp.]